MEEVSRVRALLYSQCLARAPACRAIDIAKRDRDTAMIEGERVLGLTGYDLYRLSRFCLQPPGDNSIRKAVFDAIVITLSMLSMLLLNYSIAVSMQLLGCIPVLNMPHILHKKYPWFFSAELEASMTVHVNAREVLAANFNVVDYLRNISEARVASMQRRLAEVAPTLTYSLPPAQLEGHVGSGGRSAGVLDGLASWSPPFRDVTDVLLENLWRRIDRHDGASVSLSQHYLFVYSACCDVVGIALLQSRETRRGPCLPTRE